MKKQTTTTIIVAAILAALIYTQFRLWRSFQWHEFWAQTREVMMGTRGLFLVAAVAAIYTAYVLRAVRWSLFLKPLCHVPAKDLIASQYLGFTGLALLGRPGELIRPYLIARKTNLTISSQIAVWVVERVFDTATVCGLMGVSIVAWFWNDRVIRRNVGIPVLVLEFALLAFLVLMHFYPRVIPTVILRFVSPLSAKLAHRMETKLHAFADGLNTIKDAASLAKIVAVSAVHWLLVALAYLLVAHAYWLLLPRPMKLGDVLLVMMCSMVGSMVQLPGVGGGSQLAVINILSSSIFGLSHELALSMGMMLWLVTFCSVTPAGLIIARYEKLSLKRLSSESQAEEREALQA